MGHYYEAHITIEPVFDEKLEAFKRICTEYEFRVAELIMLKRKDATPERSQFDTFCTGRGEDFTELDMRTRELVQHLKDWYFEVWRYKIESTIVDVRLK